MKLINALAVLSILMEGMLKSSDAFSTGVQFSMNKAFVITDYSTTKSHTAAARRISPSWPHRCGGYDRWNGKGVNNLGTTALSSTATISDDGSDSDSNESSTEQSILSATCNLIKGGVGSGVLSLPAGVAALGDFPKAVVPAISLIFILGGISAYTFNLLGRLTAVVNNEVDTDKGDESNNTSSSPKVTTIGDLWDYEVGPSTSYLVTLAVMLTCFGTSLSYSIILGDTFQSLAKTAGLSGIWTTRRFNVAAVAILAAYPLSCLKSLAAIAPVSIVGVVGIFVTCIVMTLRALPGGAYSSTTAAAIAAAAGGGGGSVATKNYLSSLSAECIPSFGVVGMRSPRSFLILSSMAATAFLVHMSGPEFYNTLRRPSLARFGILSGLGFGAVASISAYIMSVGFLTFGGACRGMILNNYSTLDGGATLCRLLMGVSLLGSYAFLGQAMKKAYYHIFHRGQEVSDKMHIRTTRGFVGVLTGLALLVEDAGFVVSVTGAVLGSALIYITPSYLFLRSTKRRTDNGSLEWTNMLKLERWLNRVLIVLGVFLGLSGAYMSVLNSFFRHLL
mmetsp:Transcript_37549/g.78653  ORF Transcript_37549/g.78653 Transcript_37549/m.78653 type:complete len:562 (+) Transcript_37549:301-1986(+)